MAKKTYSKKSEMGNLGPLGANQSLPPDDRGNGLPLAARAFLDTLAGPESGGDYNVIYRGDQFKSYDAHPKVWVKIPNGPEKGKFSSAAGKYQFIVPTWERAAKLAGVTDFLPASQDKAAWALAQDTYAKAKPGRDLLTDLESGDPAIMKGIPGALSSEWDSLPGGGQPGTTADQFLSIFNGKLGTASGHVVPPLGMPTDNAPVPAPRWMGSVARVLAGNSQPQPLVDLPRVPGVSEPAPTAPGIRSGASAASSAAGPKNTSGSPDDRSRFAPGLPVKPTVPYVSEDRPRSNAAVPYSRTPARAGTPYVSEDHPKSNKSGVISFGNPMAEPPQTVAAKPAAKPEGVFRYDPKNGQGTAVLPGRPSVADSLIPKDNPIKGGAAAVGATAAPKYISTSVPITVKTTNPAWTKWDAEYGSDFKNASGSPDERDERKKPIIAPPEPPRLIEKVATKMVTTLNPEFSKPVAGAPPAPGLGGVQKVSAAMEAPGLSGRAEKTRLAVEQQRLRDPTGFAIGQANRRNPNPTYNVSGDNNSFSPQSVQNSSRWQTGY